MTQNPEESYLQNPHEKIRLSLKDKKIILELHNNSRQSLSKIGKKIGLPKSVVGYRIKKMLDADLITLFCTTIDRNKWGYLYCRLFLKFRYFSNEMEKQFLKYLSQLKNIHWVASLDGMFDLGIIFLAKNIPEVEATYSKLIYHFSSHIIEKELSIATSLVHLPYNYIYEKKNSLLPPIHTPVPIIQLDQNDFLLINSIKENSRLPLLDLAKILKISPQATRERLNRLIKYRIITGFRIRIDHTKLGFHHFHVFLSLANIDEDSEKKIMHFLSSKTNITHIIKSLGKWDLEFEAVFPSHFELHELLKEFKEQFPQNVLKHEYTLIYKVHPINTVKYE